MKILEVNNLDIQGERFNGYDLIDDFQYDPNIDVKQAVVMKQSKNENVVELITNNKLKDIYYKFLNFEENILSVHSIISITTPSLFSLKEYKEADIIHFHQVHNSRLSLYTIEKVAKEKKVIYSLHDPWSVTGRCVHFYECFDWETGCNNCNYLNTMFPLKKDNCNSLWNLKKRVLSNPNINLVVSTEWMKNIVENSPITNKCNIFYIPLGIKTNEFYQKYSKKEAKKHFNIPEDNLVLFFRTQNSFKGVNFIIEALNKLDSKEKITLLTCGIVGLVNDLKEKYNVVDLGIIQNDTMIYAYNACDIFLMPSTGESFGYMAIEAMACEKPVIIFNNSAMPSVTFAPNCGVLVNNLDSEDLKNKINWLIDDEAERKKRGKLGRKIVEKTYSYEMYLKKVRNMFNEVNEKKPINFNYTMDCGNSDEEDKIKTELNKLTKGLFEYNSLEYKQLFFDKIHYVSNKKIDYSDSKVLETIDEYCNKTYNIFSTNNNEVKMKKTLKSIVVELLKKHPKLDNKIRKLLKKENTILLSPVIFEDKVSIVIPVYNGSNYVKEAIDSALSQTYKNIEIIVINDGSNDGGKTKKICKLYGDKIRYYEKENGGVSSALNLAISKMTGKYFSWLSHDDIYLPNKIDKQMEEIKKYEDKTILYSDFGLIDEHGEITLHVHRDHKLAEEKPIYSVVKGLISGITLLVPKKAFDETGLFNEEHRCVQDYELWFQMILKGYNFVHMTDILAQSRVHAKQQGNYSPTMSSEGDWLWEYMILNIPLSTKEQYEGNEFLFNVGMLDYLQHTPYKGIITKLQKTVDKMLKDTKKEISKLITTVIIEGNGEQEAVELTKTSLKEQSIKSKIVISEEPYRKETKEIDIERNKLLKNIKSDYIIFIKAGSIVNNNWVEEQLINLYMSEKGYIFSDYIDDRKDGSINNIKLIPKIPFESVVFDLKKIKNISYKNELQFLYDINKKHGSIGINRTYFQKLSENKKSIYTQISLLELYLKEEDRDLMEIASLSYDIAVLYNEKTVDNKKVKMYYPCDNLNDLKYSRSFKIYLKYLDFKKKSSKRR